jgi:uncharacterized protein YunC (DUF1805 family)
MHTRAQTLSRRTIAVGRKRVYALSCRLGRKNLVLLRGAKGYVMCGYLNLKVADSFGDVAAVITGVGTIDDALKSRIHKVSKSAAQSGIHKGQAIKDVLKIIA